MNESKSSLLPLDWQLPGVLRARLGRGVGRQRMMAHEGHLLLVLHQVPSADEVHRRGLLLWRNAHEEWRADSGESGTTALETLLSDYEGRIEEFDLAATRAQSAEDYLPVLEGLTPIVRAAHNLYQVLQEGRKASPNDRELIDFRDRAYEIARTSELNYQYAKDSLEVSIIKRAEEQAKSSRQMATSAHKLNVMAALCFPLATLGAIFGTTLTDNWSWSETSQPFVAFIVVGILAGIWFAIFVSTRRAA